MTMDEILELERKCERQQFEHRMATARWEAMNKATNDMFQACWIVYNAQVMALVYASLNPEFCKP